MRKYIDDENLSAHLRRNASEMVSNYNKIKNSFNLECGIIKLAQNLFFIHMGGEPCCEVKFNLMPLFNQSNVIFTGYTDACAYIVPDSMILEGGYEVRSFLEYKHKGRILSGIDSLLYNAFSDAKTKFLL